MLGIIETAAARALCQRLGRLFPALWPMKDTGYTPVFSSLVCLFNTSGDEAAGKSLRRYGRLDTPTVEGYAVGLGLVFRTRPDSSFTLIVGFKHQLLGLLS